MGEKLVQLRIRTHKTTVKLCELTEQNNNNNASKNLNTGFPQFGKRSPIGFVVTIENGKVWRGARTLEKQCKLFKSFSSSHQRALNPEKHAV